MDGQDCLLGLFEDEAVRLSATSTRPQEHRTSTNTPPLPLATSMRRGGRTGADCPSRPSIRVAFAGSRQMRRSFVLCPR
ncbi:hypothetical protein CGRA01v4_10247 [Colletotrichum graminicola]|nr:hypothetical protein CGRA01v4_10247 [Colletotrichum graminicola]